MSFEFALKIIASKHFVQHRIIIYKFFGKFTLLNEGDVISENR